MRELDVGASTLKAIWANKAAPGLVDLYLARRGVESQLDDEPVEPDRPDNLWRSPPGDRGAHGRFTDEALQQSTAFHLRRHRKALLLCGATLGLGLLAAARKSPQRA